MPSSSGWSSSTRCTAASSGSPTLSAERLPARLRRRLRRPPGEAGPGAAAAVSVSQPGGLAAVFAPEPPPTPCSTRCATCAPTRPRASASCWTDAQRSRHGNAPAGDRSPRDRRFERRRHRAHRSHRRGAQRRGDPLAQLSHRVRSRSALQVAFESSSEVFGAVDNPRGYRVWRGTLEVEGATAHRRAPHRPRQPAARPPRVGPGHAAEGALPDPHPRPRRLDPARPRWRERADAVHFQLDAAKEAGAASTRRPLHDIPAADVTLTLDDLDRRQARARDAAGRRACRSHRAPGGRRPERRSIASSTTPTSIAALEGRRGDYYYVRVTQLDGGRAWTSPFWVGGKSTRRLDGTSSTSRSGSHWSVHPILRRESPWQGSFGTVATSPISDSTARRSAAPASARRRATTRTRCRWRSRRRARCSTPPRPAVTTIRSRSIDCCSRPPRRATPRSSTPRRCTPRSTYPARSAPPRWAARRARGCRLCSPATTSPPRDDTRWW